MQFALRVNQATHVMQEWLQANKKGDLTDQSTASTVFLLPYKAMSYLGLNTASTNLWVAAEWYIHYQALKSFSDVLHYAHDHLGKDCGDAANSWDSFSAALHGKALFLLLGACQTLFTRYFDIPRYAHVDNTLQSKLGNTWTRGTNRFWNNLLDNPVLRPLLSANIINVPKVFLLSRAGAFYMDLVLKVLVGGVIGAVAGQKATVELRHINENMSEEAAYKLFLGCTISLGLIYALAVNFIQGKYAKAPDVITGTEDYATLPCYSGENVSLPTKQTVQSVCRTIKQSPTVPYSILLALAGLFVTVLFDAFTGPAEHHPFTDGIKDALTDFGFSDGTSMVVAAHVLATSVLALLAHAILNTARGKSPKADVRLSGSLGDSAAPVYHRSGDSVLSIRTMGSLNNDAGEKEGGGAGQPYDHERKDGDGSDSPSGSDSDSGPDLEAPAAPQRRVDRYRVFGDERQQRRDQWADLPLTPRPPIRSRSQL